MRIRECARPQYIEGKALVTQVYALNFARLLIFACHLYVEGQRARVLFVSCTFNAGWQLCLECVCERLVVGPKLFHLSWRLDLSHIFEYALT